MEPGAELRARQEQQCRSPLRLELGTPAEHERRLFTVAPAARGDPSGCTCGDKTPFAFNSQGSTNTRLTRRCLRQPHIMMDPLIRSTLWDAPGKGSHASFAFLRAQPGLTIVQARAVRHGAFKERSRYR